MRKCTVIVRYGIGVALIVRFPAREKTGAAALHTTRVTPDRITNAFHRMAELFDLREDPDELDNVIDRPGTGRCMTSAAVAAKEA